MAGNAALTTRLTKVFDRTAAQCAFYTPAIEKRSASEPAFGEQQILTII